MTDSGPHEKSMALLLSVVMVLSMITLGGVVAADSATANESGNVGLEDLDGDGTPDDPYVITNASALQVMEDDLAAHYELGEDVDASETEGWNDGDGFDPVGEEEDEFTGTFDGNGHTITGLNIDRIGEDGVGLFGYTDGATIENVTLEDVKVRGSGDVGSLVGKTSEGVIAGSSADAEITSDVSGGGLVGTAVDSKITESSAVSAMSGLYDTGGLVGTNVRSEISNSTAVTPEERSVSSEFRAGGLVGKNDGGKIVDSEADSRVLGLSTSGGGLVGVSEGGEVSRSSAYGDVVGHDALGGLIGISEGGKVSQSSAHGDISSLGGENHGGLVGHNDGGVIVESTSSGTVSSYYGTTGGLVGTTTDGEIRDVAATGDVSGGSTVGALVGKNDDSEVSGAYATGTVEGDSPVGGVVGEHEGEVTGAYWDVETTEQSDAVGAGNGTLTDVDGLTTDELTGLGTQANATGLDFAETWVVTETYPQLAWQVDPAFEVEVTDTNSPVTEGDTLDVTVKAESLDEDQLDRTIQLTVEDAVRDEATVTLDPGAAETVTLNWETSESDDGEYTALATGIGSGDGADVTVGLESDSGLSDPGTVELVGVDAPDNVDAGAEFTVDVEVENPGDTRAESAVTFELGVDEASGSEEVSLDGGDATTVTFDVTAPDRVSDYNLAVETGHDTASTTVSVSEASMPTATPTETPHTTPTATPTETPHTSPTPTETGTPTATETPTDDEETPGFGVMLALVALLAATSIAVRRRQ